MALNLPTIDSTLGILWNTPDEDDTNNDVPTRVRLSARFGCKSRDGAVTQSPQSCPSLSNTAQRQSGSRAG
jgi:hypothetical protein